MVGEFIAKYDSAGNFLWAKNFDAACNHPYMSSCTDNDGNYYLTGTYGYDSLFFNGSYLNSGRYQMYLLKFSPSGGEIWARTSSMSEISGK